MLRTQRNTERIILFVSTGRTATKAIASFFSTVPGVTARHEPPPARLLRILANMYMCGRISGKTMSRALWLTRGHVISRRRTPIYLEASPFLRGCLEVLEEIFGEVWLVHIVRHPATYIPSYINHGAFHGLKGWIGNRLPYWMPKPEECEKGPERPWAQMPIVERVAWRWALLNRELNRGETLFPKRYYRVRYEDLFDPERQGLVEAARWLGITVPVQDFELKRQERVNASRARRFPPLAEWDDATRFVVDSICGELMSEYGYTL